MSLERYRVVFFLSGLVLASFAALTTLQWEFVNETVQIDDEPEGEVIDVGVVLPRTFPDIPDPPKSQEKVVDEILKPNFFEPKIVVPNTTDLSISSEFEDPGFVPILEVRSEGDPHIPVDRFNVDRLPIFNGCEQYNGSERERCMNQELTSRIQAGLRFTDQDKYLMNGTRVFVEFVVGVDGEVKEVTVHRCPTANMERQLKEIVGNLPAFMPGLKDGKEQAVKLTLPVRLNTL